MDKIIDNINIPFTNDENVIGKWEFADFVSTIDEFNPIIPTHLIEPYLTFLEFLPLGEMRMGINLGELDKTSFTWTNGYIINSIEQTCSSYIIKEINGQLYLFFEWKSGDYVYNGLNPKYYILRKADI